MLAGAFGLGSRARGDRPLLDPRTVLTALGVAVYDWDLASDEIEWARNAADVLGLADMSGWSSGRDFGTLIEPDHAPTIHETIRDSRELDAGSGVPYSLIYTIRPTPGRAVVVEDCGRWYADPSGKPAFAHGMLRIQRSDGADSKESQAGARDRAQFLSRIGEEVSGTTRSKNLLTLVIVAVDNMAALNDRIGFDAADAVLDEVFRRMRATMRRRDRYARYAGNRFALALRSCPPDQVRIAVDRLIRTVSSTPIETAGGPVSVQLLFGAATAPQHANDAAALLRCAEQSLVWAKQGRGPLVLYDPALAQGERRRRAPSIDVLDLLNARKITFACQPVVEAGSRHVAFHEALLRVRGDDGRITTAADVIPAVERLGLVPLVDIRILELCTSHLAANPGAKLAINMSPMTLESPDWLPALAANLGAYPGISSRLIIELTETLAIGDPDATRRRLDAMKALGVGIAIDDFGAGHTSFKHLRSFPVDLVKIDGAFAQNLARSTDDRFFVRTLIDLAHHLGIPTVAEWIEDETTARLLAGWGVDYLQGDHCGRPELVASSDWPRLPLSA